MNQAGINRPDFLKRAALAKAKTLLHSMIDLSQSIHRNPEVAFEETKACRWLEERLAVEHFHIKSSLGGIATAFEATKGFGDLKIALCAEYDALPVLGHACGHNIIAAISCGAGILLGALAEELNISVSVIGTPGEEIGDGGGKIVLLDSGAFDDVHMAMMAHPAPIDCISQRYRAAALITVRFEEPRFRRLRDVRFYPTVSDAMLLAQTATSLLARRLPRAFQIDSVVTEAGIAANIQPHLTEAKVLLRAPCSTDLEAFRKRVEACFLGAAQATACEVVITGGLQPYKELKQDKDIAESYARNALILGRRMSAFDHANVDDGASTDMGNVSQQVPSIHPCISLSSFPIINHDPEFTSLCVGREANRAIRDGMLALAWTGIDVALNGITRQRLLGLKSKRLVS